MKSSIFLALVFMLASCAGADVRPVTDMKGVDTVAYENDLKECQEYASQKPGAAETAAKGGVGGGILGGILGLVGGGTGTKVAQGAGVGATIGVGGGSILGNKAQEDMVKNCLRGRGYKVLD